MERIRPPNLFENEKQSVPMKEYRHVFCVISFLAKAGGASPSPTVVRANMDGSPNIWLRIDVGFL